MGKDKARKGLQIGERSSANAVHAVKKHQKKNKKKQKQVNKVLREIIQDDSSDDMEDQIVDGPTFNVDFDFFDPTEEHLPGITPLVTQLMPNQNVSSSDLSKCICSQSRVGTVVIATRQDTKQQATTRQQKGQNTAQEEEDSIVAFITCLSNSNENSKGPVGQYVHELANAINEVAGERAKLRLLNEWSSKKCGLLINCRLLNAPAEMSGPLMESILLELMWATEDEPTLDLRRSFCINSVIVVCRAMVIATAQSGVDTQTSKKKRKKAAKTSGLAFLKPEDEFMVQLAAWKVVCSPYSDKPDAGAKSASSDDEDAEAAEYKLVIFHISLQNMYRAWMRACAVIEHEPSENAEQIKEWLNIDDDASMMPSSMLSQLNQKKKKKKNKK